MQHPVVILEVLLYVGISYFAIRHPTTTPQEADTPTLGSWERAAGRDPRAVFLGGASGLHGFMAEGAAALGGVPRARDECRGASGAGVASGPG